MKCLLKRVLPFALTLMMGVALWVMFGQAPRITCTLSQNYGGIGVGSGVGWSAQQDVKGKYDNPFNPQDVDRKAQILWRLEPQYPEEARINRVEGTVVLQGVVTENGWVRSIRVVSGWPEFLSWSAIEATGQIKFSPAMKDGHPVAQYIQIEYNFSLY